MNQKYGFQYCQKLVVLSNDCQQAFLAKRSGEADYDGAFSFIGGKMETTDSGIIAGLKREKDEEVGPAFRLNVYPQSTFNILFQKKDGNSMILPHYLAIYLGGKVALNTKEYSEGQWVNLIDLETFGPKIDNIPEVVKWALNLNKHLKPQDFVEI